MNSLAPFWYCILDCMLPCCCPKVILHSRPTYKNLLFKHFTKKVFLIESVNFDCIFLPCHVHVSEWIHTLKVPECQGTPCPKQARNLKVKWLQLDSNPEPLSSQRNTQPNGSVFIYELSGSGFESSCSVNFLSSELKQFGCFHRHVFDFNPPRRSITVNNELIFAYLAANWQLVHSRIYLI